MMLTYARAASGLSSNDFANEEGQEPAAKAESQRQRLESLSWNVSCEAHRRFSPWIEEALRYGARLVEDVCVF